MHRTHAQRLGESNKALVWNHLRRSGAASVDQLVRATGRSQPTVLKWLATLEREGLVRKAGTLASSGGRPATRYEYVGDRALVLGVSVEIPSFSLALVDLGGAPVAHQAGTLPTDATPAVVVAHLLARTLDFLRPHAVAQEPAVHRPAAAGIAFSGFIDRDTGSSLATPRLPGWRDVRVRQVFADALACPVVLNHHIDALTVAEIHGGSAISMEDFLYFDVGHGLGVRAVRGGEPLLGRFGNAGLIGHTTVVPDGRPCVCGNRGCLEEYVSGRALLREAVLVVTGEDRGHPDITGVATSLFDAAARGERRPAALLDEVERFLAIGIANAINVFEQPRVILSGFASSLGGPFRDRLAGATRRRLQETLARSFELRFATQPRAASGAWGAALFALRHHLPFADPLVVERRPEGSALLPTPPHAPADTRDRPSIAP